MGETYNIYCDESCHLEHSESKAMVLGAVWCPAEKSREISVRLREKKREHGMPAPFEAKWTKVSPGGLALYKGMVDYFFDDDDLHFRGVVIPDRSVLRHDRFNQTHDDFYYKMYFSLLKTILNPGDTYRIYLDLKDTRGARKIEKLREVLCNNVYDLSLTMIERIQLVRSHEVEILQLADLLSGAVGYAHRGLSTSDAKTAIVSRIRERSKYTLMQNTLYRESKVNLLVWRATEFDDAPAT